MGSGARRRGRLSRSGDFDRVYKEGTSHATRHLVLYRFPRPADDTSEVRLGVSVSRKVGGAVDRNRVKRVIREAFWKLDELPANHDFVVVAKRELGDLVEEQGESGVKMSLEQALSGERST